MAVNPATTSVTHVHGSATSDIGAYIASERSRSSYVLARLPQRLNSERIATNTQRVSTTGSPLGRTTVRTARPARTQTSTAPPPRLPRRAARRSPPAEASGAARQQTRAARLEAQSGHVPTCGLSARLGHSRKSRLFIAPSSGRGSMRSATTLITPSCFSSRPRISSAGAAPSDPSMADPAALRAHDVDEPGLVLEVDEDGARRGGRALAVGHHAADEHPSPAGTVRRGQDAGPRRASRGGRARSGWDDRRGSRRWPTGRRSPLRATTCPAASARRRR